ncbi:hypothetical protein HaLaN_30462, partial [Haematococcus lacustris]
MMAYTAEPKAFAADGFSPARHGLNADSSWLGSAGHPQDIAQCRRVVGALRIGAAASPRGAQAPVTLPAHSTCQQPTLAGPAAYHHLLAPPHCPSA